MAFHGNIVLITGGASGIGKVHATTLAGRGAKVIVIDLNETGLKEISSVSANIIALKCDVSELEEAQGLVAKVEREIGAIDRLIHCAAIIPGGLLSEVPATQIAEVMRISHSFSVGLPSGCGYTTD